MNNEKIRDSFIFYRSFFQSTKRLTKEDKAELFEAICSYALDGESIEMSAVPDAIFSVIKPNLDANRRKWENGCKEKKKTSKTEATEERKISKSEANQKQSRSKVEGNVDVDVDVNDIISSLRSEIKISDDLWVSFLEHRKKVKASLTLDAQKLVLEKLKIWKGVGHDPELIIKNSIENGWKGVFEPKGSTATEKPKQIHNNFKNQDYYAGTEGFKVD